MPKYFSKSNPFLTRPSRNSCFSLKARARLETSLKSSCRFSSTLHHCPDVPRLRSNVHFGAVYRKIYHCKELISHHKPLKKCHFLIPPFIFSTLLSCSGGTTRSSLHATVQIVVRGKVRETRLTAGRVFALLLFMSAWLTHTVAAVCVYDTCFR